MPVFQYKCDQCLSVFEHLVWASEEIKVSCVACDSKKVTRLYSSNFGIHLQNGGCTDCSGGGCDKGFCGSGGGRGCGGEGGCGGCSKSRGYSLKAFAT